MEQRREFILKLAKALLSYGAPSHRIESQLAMVSTILEARVSFVHIPSVIMVSLGDGGTKTMQTHFVRANSRIALSNLEQVHAITREVCRDKIACDTGTELLDNVLSAKALYPLYMRCFYCFICGSIICATAFGGSVIDMWISGTCAAFLGYLSLSPTTQQSSMIDNVYEYVPLSTCLAMTDLHHRLKDFCLNLCLVHRQSAQHYQRRPILLQRNFLSWGCSYSAWLYHS
jgi:uncharacterized membrane protein YjjP (DUF1212 family)